MGKKIKVFIMVFFMFFLCSCSGKKEYNLIEITGEELIDNLINGEDKKFIFALTDSSADNYEIFMKNLSNVSKSTKNNIYYIESSYIDTASSIFLYNFDMLDFDNNSYYTFNGSSFDVLEKYVDLSSLYANLKNFSSKGEIDKVDDAQKKAYIEEAKAYYENGQIAMAFDMLNRAWDTDEAKEFYKEGKYFLALKSWENYAYEISDAGDKSIYTSWIFYHGVNFYSVAVKEGEYNHDFTNDEFYVEDFVDVYYKIIDDAIYTSDTEDGDYKKTYEILDLNESTFKLREIKTKKEIVLERFV